MKKVNLKINPWVLSVFILAVSLVVVFVVPKIAVFETDEVTDKTLTIRDLIAIEHALDLYQLNTFRYPSEVEGLHVLLKTSDNRGYLLNIPTDPWGNDYQYKVNSDSEVEVFSMGPDGVVSHDDIYNTNYVAQ